jgi:hypothetical protein
MTLKEAQALFEKYKDIPLRDIALVIGYSYQQVIALKEIVDEANKTPEIIPQEIWDNKEWFVEHYVTKKIGICKIGRMIKKSPSFVIRTLNDYGITIKKHVSTYEKTDFKNEEWLREHYCSREEYLEWCSIRCIIPKDGCGKGMTVTDCANLCGALPQTVAYWICKYNIKTRSNNENAIIKQKRAIKEAANRGGFIKDQNTDSNKSY